jgi:hypothetical protein
MTNQFIPGLELNRRFYSEAVKPILLADFPHLQFSAARIGNGSEVLGYDTPLSTDHDWGPRLQLFLRASEYDQFHAEVSERLRHHLPPRFLGYSTHFGDPDDEGTRLLVETAGPVNHRVEIWTVRAFFNDYMAYDPDLEPTVFDWLSWPQQHLLAVTAGEVYDDYLGELKPLRHRLKQYPYDVWLYLLAAQWRRIGQEEAFVGRVGDIGDEIGSKLLASRLVHDLMQLCFLMERTYAPYPKWFGTAFSRLTCAPRLTPILFQILDAQGWRSREDYLCQAYEIMAEMHNALGITQPLATDVRTFHNRPFRVIEADRFVDALKEAMTDLPVKAIGTDIGSIDQFSHSTDLRSDPLLHKKLQSLYK